MCMAMSLTAQQHYFGRTLELDQTYGEAVIITPRRFPLDFRRAGTLHQHYAMIGAGVVADGCPLYFDATNEHGLSMAGLRFAGCAHYREEQDGCDNIAPFEIIPWVLGQCRSVQEARTLLRRMNPVSIAFSDEIPLTPMHWLLDDRTESLVIEPMPDGVHVYENPVRVLTNSPAFPAQLEHLAQYRALSPSASEQRLPVSAALPMCLGAGCMGLPGDYTSLSRFVRAAFLRGAGACELPEEEYTPHFFRVLGSVAPPMGAVLTEEGKPHYMRYASCCNADTGAYHYMTYADFTLRAVHLQHAELDGTALSTYPMIAKCETVWQN